MKKLLYLSVLLCLTACHSLKKEVVFTENDLNIIPSHNQWSWAEDTFSLPKRLFL